MCRWSPSAICQRGTTSDTIDAIIERGGKRDLIPMRWGLIPNWWKKTIKEISATFNARAETVAAKPMFRDTFKRMIPASGYYEWLPAAARGVSISMKGLG